MRLEDYRRREGLSYEALARLVGANNTNAAWRWCQGEAPERMMAARISAATDGLVSVQELLYPNGVPPGARLAASEEEEGVECDEDGGGKGDAASAGPVGNQDHGSEVVAA